MQLNNNYEENTFLVNENINRVSFEYYQEDSKQQKYQQIQMINIVMMIFCLFKIIIQICVLQKNTIVNYDYPIDIWLQLLMFNEILWMIYNISCLYIQTKHNNDIFLNDSFISQIIKKNNKNDKIIEQIDPQLLDELNSLDSFNLIYELNHSIELKNPLILLLRHCNQFYYLLIYIYGCYMYLFLYQQNNQLDEDLQEIFMLFLLFQTTYIFLPIFLFIISILLIPLIFCLQLNLDNESQKPLQKNKFEQIMLINYQQKDKISDECSICKMDFNHNEKICQLPCNHRHVFHQECIFYWLKINSICPICRLDLNSTDFQNLYKNQLLDHIYNEEDQEAAIKKGSQKFCHNFIKQFNNQNNQTFS